MNLYIPLVMHVPLQTSTGQIASCPIGAPGPPACGPLPPDFGNGCNQPLQDTLIAIYNDSSQEVTVRLSVYDGMSGQARIWPSQWMMCDQAATGSTYMDITLPGPDANPIGWAIAMTFIKGNPLIAPQNFRGFGLAEVLTPNANVTGTSFTGGGGCVLDHWNNWTVEIPHYGTLTARAQFAFPYVVPLYEDQQHNESLSYRAKGVVTSFEDPTNGQSCWIWATYTVGDTWPLAGNKYTFKKELNPWRQLFFDLDTELVNAGYPVSTNSTGWLLIESRESATPGSPLANRLLSPLVYNSNRDFNRFGCGVPYWRNTAFMA